MKNRAYFSYNERMRKYILGFFICLFFLFIPLASIRADSIDDQINQIKKSLDALTTDLKNKESDQARLNAQLESIKNQLASLDSEIQKKEKEVEVGEKALTYQNNLLKERARAYYKNARKVGVSLVDFLVAENLSTSLDDFFYKKAVVDEDKNMIVSIVLYIKNLEEKKVELQNEKKELATLRVTVDEQSRLVERDIASTRQKIAELSAQQQQLVAQKQASLNIPRSAGTSARGCSDDRGVDPGFSPRLAFFTYGAPHRNGLNQYGAWGRAKAGENEEQILAAYYPNMSLKKDYDQNIRINTTTGWGGTIEEYVNRIYEVPDSWTDNNLAVLKAQAVAARTYALRVTENGAKQICTTEQCQVFKDTEKGGNWKQAVEDTKGWVMMDGDRPGFTQYASTHGGYVRNIGKFDGKDGNPGNFSELNDRAYDKDSPWFYCDWGARANYSNTAWLKPSEVADIVNVILLARADSGTGNHLYQTDKPHPYGGEVWNEERVRQELKNRNISPFTSVTDVSVGVDFGGGTTNGVTASGDAGSVSFSGDEFKNWFNLRAPANIQIVGPLFNVEKR